MRIKVSVSLREDQKIFIEKHRYSPSKLLQEAIDNLMVEDLELKATLCKPFVMLKHETLDSNPQ